MQGCYILVFIIYHVLVLVRKTEKDVTYTSWENLQANVAHPTCITPFDPSISSYTHFPAELIK